MTTPLPIGVTMGDGAGIGPEIILRLLTQPPYTQSTVVYGSSHVFRKTLDHLRQLRPTFSCPENLETLGIEALRNGDTFSAGCSSEKTLRVVDVSGLLPEEARRAIQSLEKIPFGEHFAPFAHLQLFSLTAAIEDTQNGLLRGICTAPWNKALFKSAGLPPSGHTEILGEKAGAPPYMMLGGDRLRVALVTTHVPLKEVSSRLSEDKILHTIRAVHRDLQRWWKIPSPRLALAALNPHAGEMGTMGREEIDILQPALDKARVEGFEISGPWPSDTLFSKAAADSTWPYDAVICMYHDQALIPLKLLHFGDSANITLNLPFLRTSVDHGTAYDIAGKGTADMGSMKYALKMALTMA